MVYIREQQFNIGEEVLNKHYSKVVGLLGSYANFFPLCFNAFDICNQFLYPINTTDASIHHSKSNLTPEQNQLLKKKVEQLCLTGHLKPSQSKWSSPVYPYIKENGKLELYVDFRELNEITIDYKYNLNQSKDIVEYVAASEAVLFTKLVLRDPFYQLKIGDNTAYKTAISTDFGVYQFSTLTETLKNAKSYLQMTLEKILSDSNLTETDMSSVSVYLGEILIYSSKFSDHFELVKNVLKSLKYSNLRLDSEKSSFFTNRVYFLDHILDKDGLSLDQNKLTKILNHPPPKDKCELFQFFDLVKHFEAYVPNYDQIVRPLANNYPDFKWDSTEEAAYEELKIKLALMCPF